MAMMVASSVSKRPIPSSVLLSLAQPMAMATSNAANNLLNFCERVLVMRCVMYGRVMFLLIGGLFLVKTKPGKLFSECLFKVTFGRIAIRPH